MDPAGPFGAKEVGQGPLLPIMPALANAVYDAVGVRIDEVPVTPEKILKALQQKAAGKPARVGPAAFPDNVPWPETLMVTPPWEGGDGRASNEPAKKSKRKADAGVEATAGVRHDAPAGVRLSRASHRSRRGRAVAGGRPQVTPCCSPAAPTCCRT